MLNKRGVAAIIFVFLVVLLIFSIRYETKKENVLKINNAIENGFDYLDQIYVKDSVYQDKYLIYVYPGENLSCPEGYDEKCVLTYRKMDAYFDLVFMKKELIEEKYKKIRYQVDEADSMLKAILPIWENGTIYNIIKEKEPGKKAFALDTYCILGFMYNDSKMAEVVADSLTQKDWMEKETYAEVDRWRQIADESWCVMLLAETRTDNVVMEEQLKIKIEELKSFIDDKGNSELDKAAAAIHVLMVLNELKEAGYNIEQYNKDYKYFADYLIESTKKDDVTENTLILANIIHVLSKTSEREKLWDNVDMIIERQDQNGAFYPAGKEKTDTGQAFTTLRVILALNAYSK